MQKLFQMEPYHCCNEYFEVHSKMMVTKEMKDTLMNLLIAEHSKSQMQAIVSFVGNSQARFDALVIIFLENDRKLTQRASWPLSNCVEHHPGLVQKHLKQLLNKMNDPQQHPAVKRQVLRIFDMVEIPRSLHGQVMDVCINTIASTTEAVAAQAFALGILQKLTTIYPEIRHEVKTIIDSRMPYATAGFKSRAAKYLKAI